MNPSLALRQIERRALHIRARRAPGWHEALIACMHEWEDLKSLLAARGTVNTRYTWADVMAPEPEPKGTYHHGPAEDYVEYVRR